MITGMSLWSNVEATGPEFRVNTYTTSEQTDPSVASLPNGNFVVAWTSAGQDSFTWGVYGQRFDGATGAKLGPEFRVNTYTTSDQMGLSVASLPNGNFVVTWHNYEPNGSTWWGVYGQRFDGATGAMLGSEFRVSTYTTSAQRYPSIASLPDSSFVVTWMTGEQDGSNWGVYGQRFDGGTGATLGLEFLVNTYTTNAQMYPSVASLPNGNFVVTWMSDGQDGSSWGIYGQRFNGTTGAKLGSEFRANTYTTSYQSESAITSLLNGSFVVTWISYLMVWTRSFKRDIKSARMKCS
jgi:hypothetical protein